MRNIFLVGAPRSGTTILQSLLAAHPQITSFPETKFFHYLWANRLTSKFPDRIHQWFYEEIKRPDLYDHSEVCRQSTSDRIEWFVRVLNRLAAEEGNEIWLEKTPEHVYFVRDILNYLPDAGFIHIVRHPLDVVASMRKATQDPLLNELWGGKWTLDFCIQRWNTSVQVACNFRTTPQHLVVRYEDLVQDKIKILSQCCHLIDVSYSPEMLQNYRAKALKLAMEFPWHKGIDREIAPAISPKYKNFLSAGEIQYVLEKTEELRLAFGYANPDPENPEPGLNC